MNVLKKENGYVRLYGFDSVIKRGKATIKPEMSALVIDSRDDPNIDDFPDRMEVDVIDGCIKDAKALELIELRCEDKNTAFYELEGLSYIQMRYVHLPDDWKEEN